MQRTKIDRAVVRADWAAQGFSCEVWVDPPNQVWHDFQHDVDELVLLLEGDLTIELGGRTVRLAVGDELLIPANTRHTVRNADSTARWLYGYRMPRAGA
jgi:mannose-6-phosphate isomerase-like protein (cupin superfamily)